MKSLYYDGNNAECRELPMPGPVPGESVIELLAGGICRTDLEICRGYMGFAGVLGHEFVGRALDGPHEGMRVVGEINAACGSCGLCRMGLRGHCAHRTVLGIAGRNGAFAEYFMLPHENLIPVPGSLTDEEAVFTEPLAAALEIREQLELPPSWDIAVIGDGRLAYLAAQVLRISGNSVFIFGKHESKLEQFRKIGIETVSEDDARYAAKFPVVVECSGHPAGMERAMRLLRPRGTLVLKSTYHGKPGIDLARIVVSEWKVLGSRCGPFQPALRLLAGKGIEVMSMISGKYHLSEGCRALQAAARPESRKVLLYPDPRHD